MEILIALFVISLIAVGALLFKYYKSVSGPNTLQSNFDELGYEHSDLLIDQYIELIDSKEDIDVRLEKKNILIDKMRINYNARKEAVLIADKQRGSSTLSRP